MYFSYGLFLPLLFTLSFSGPIQHNVKFSSIVAFGDSFTDNGNGSFALTNQTWPADPAYFDGRFSNGPTWIEDVAATLSIPLLDHAFGGATTSNKLVQGFTGPNNTIPVPGVAEQVSTFLLKKDRSVDIESSLFVVFGGLNDILFNTNLTTAQIVGALSGSIINLVDAGARHFLMLNYYDASEIPFDQFTDIATKAVLTQFSSDFGNQVSLLAKGFQSQLASQGGSVTYLDLLPLFRQFYFYGEPASFGFDKFGAYGSCLVGAYEEVPVRSLCTDADQRVFFDEYHPSRRTHMLIAGAAVRAFR